MLTDPICRLQEELLHQLDLPEFYLREKPEHNLPQFLQEQTVDQSLCQVDQQPLRLGIPDQLNLLQHLADQEMLQDRTHLRKAVQWKRSLTQEIRPELLLRVTREAMSPELRLQRLDLNPAETLKLLLLRQEPRAPHLRRDPLSLELSQLQHSVLLNRELSLLLLDLSLQQ